MTTNRQKLYLLLLGIIFISFCIVFIFKFQFQPGWDFRNNLWGPVHLLVNHLSPYNIHVLYENSNSVWMPMAVGALFPFGYLSLQQASNVWWLINIFALLLIIFLSSPETGFSITSFLQLVLLFVFFPSTMSLFLLGQISIITCLILLITVWYDQKIHPFFIGLLLAFSLAKPQLSIFFILSYLVISYKDRGGKILFRLLLSIGCGIVLGCLPLFIFFPQWIPDFLQNLSSNPIWFQPSLYSLVFQKLDRIGNILSMVFFLSGAGICAFLSWRLPKKLALLWCLALTTIFSPYIWSWDFVLLLPVFGYYYSQPSRSSRLILFIGFTVCLIFSISLKLLGKVSDEINWWIPLYIVAIILLSNINVLKIKRLSSSGRFTH